MSPMGALCFNESNGSSVLMGLMGDLCSNESNGSSKF